jgi:LPXTG-motif cell wall-anchored protein
MVIQIITTIGLFLLAGILWYLYFKIRKKTDTTQKT